MGKEGTQPPEPASKPSTLDIIEAVNHTMNNLPNEHDEQEIELNLLQEALKKLIPAPLKQDKPKKQLTKREQETEDWSPF